MGSQKLLVVGIALSVVQIVRGQVWQFGADNNPAAVVISNYQGHFTLLDREQSVKLIVSKNKLYN